MWRVFLVTLALGCGGTRGAAGSPYVDPPSSPPVHAHNDSTIELAADEIAYEPEAPPLGLVFAGALSHVHAPRGTCSGALLAPRVVVTAHQCVGDDVRGINLVPPTLPFFVEAAAAGGGWTRHRVTHSVTAGCLWERFDLAMLVLAEPVSGGALLRVVAPPDPGVAVQALGFGRCRGETRGLANRLGQLLTRESDALVIGVPLCKGDVGGPVVVPGTLDVVGIVSHQDDPDDRAHRTTTLARLDSLTARALLAQALAIVKGDDPSRLGTVACE